MSYCIISNMFWLILSHHRETKYKGNTCKYTWSDSKVMKLIFFWLYL